MINYGMSSLASDPFLSLKLVLPRKLKSYNSLIIMNFFLISEYRETVRVTFAEPEMRTANLRDVIASYLQKQRHQTHWDQKTNATTECTPEGKQHKSKVICLSFICQITL